MFKKFILLIVVSFWNPLNPWMLDTKRARSNMFGIQGYDGHS